MAAALVSFMDIADDTRLLGLWLHGRAKNTEAAYRRDIARFLAFTEKPLGSVSLGDLQAFSDSLRGMSLVSRSRVLSTVKSLIAFAHRLGYIPFDVGSTLRLPRRKNTLAERILPEADVLRILHLEPDPRNSVMLRLLYASAVRVSELCSLSWRDARSNGDGTGQITIFGKGGKTRVVFLQATVWELLAALPHGKAADGPIFISRKGGPLVPRQVERIVRVAAKRAGITAAVSPHWMRHAHASHSLDRGASLHLVQTTLGHASIAITGMYLHVRPKESSGCYLAV
jgi:integrase/recombinase XerD